MVLIRANIIVKGLISLLQTLEKINYTPKKINLDFPLLKKILKQQHQI